MSRLAFWAILAIPAFTSHMLAATYYVGGCRSTSFPTISAAVSSPSVAAVSVIKICPGQYNYEQIVISKPLTLQGMSGSTGDSAVLICDDLCLTMTSSSVYGSPVAPSIWVTTGPVNISTSQFVFAFRLFR